MDFDDENQALWERISGIEQLIAERNWLEANQEINDIRAMEVQIGLVYPEIMSYIYALCAQMIAIKNAVGLAEVESYLAISHQYLEKIDDEELHEFMHMEMALFVSKIYIMLGEYSKAYDVALRLYQSCKGNTDCIIYWIGAINNLSVILYQKGLIKECKTFLEEGMELINTYDLYHLVSACNVYSIWMVVSGNIKADTKSEAILINFMEHCNCIDESNYFFVVTCIKLLFKNWISRVKDTNFVSEILSKIEDFCNQCQETPYQVQYYLLEAEYLFYKKNYNQSGQYFEQAFLLEISKTDAIDLCTEFVCIYPDVMIKILEPNRCKEILFQLIHRLPKQYNEYIELCDQDFVLKQLNMYTAIFRVIISLVCSMHFSCSDEELLEIIVNCKSIYPDILKEKRILRDADYENKKKYEEINFLYRTIHDMEMGRFFSHATDDSKIIQLKNEKQKKELELTVSHKEIFKWLSFKEICSRLPVDTVYIDYIQFPRTIRRESILGDLDIMYISLYKKADNQYIINRYPTVNFLLARKEYMVLSSFVRTNKGETRKLIAETIFGQEVEKNKNLYRLMLQAVIKSIPNSIKTLLISGDVEINNYPFEMLINEKNEYVVDSYEVIYVNSLRNINDEFSYSIEQVNETLVLGNPRFTFDKGIHIQNSNQYLLPLPMSKVEVQVVADFMETNPFTGKDAQKEILKNSNCELLHIATHGSILEDADEETDALTLPPLRKSCIYLAGANDWIIKGSEVEGCGTGLVTAEELCTYYMPNLKMVVLSTCFSGSGNIDYSQGLIGIRTTLMALGAKVVVSNIWEVDDFASAVFMDSFYSYLKAMSISKAFRQAQLFIREITIEGLKSNGWFGEQRIRRIGLAAEEMKRKALLPPDTKLFSAPKYWAGFMLFMN